MQHSHILNLQDWQAVVTIAVIGGGGLASLVSGVWWLGKVIRTAVGDLLKRLTNQDGQLAHLAQTVQEISVYNGTQAMAMNELQRRVDNSLSEFSHVAKSVSRDVTKLGEGQAKHAERLAVLEDERRRREEIRHLKESA